MKIYSFYQLCIIKNHIIHLNILLYKILRNVANQKNF